MRQDDENREEVHIGHGPRIRIGQVHIGLEGILGLVAILIVGAVALSLIFARNQGATSSAPAPTPVPAVAASPGMSTPMPTAPPNPAPISIQASTPTPAPTPTPTPTTIPTPSPVPVAAVTSLVNLFGARYPWPAVTAPDRVLLEGDAPTALGLTRRSTLPAHLSLIEDDGMRVVQITADPPGPGGKSTQFGSTLWGNVALRVRLKALGGHVFLQFRHLDREHNYGLGIDTSTGRAQLLRRTGLIGEPPWSNERRTLAQAGMPVEHNRWHDLEIRIVNDTVVAFLDGSLVIYAKDQEPLPRGIWIIGVSPLEGKIPGLLRLSHIQVTEISSIETASPPRRTPMAPPPPTVAPTPTPTATPVQLILFKPEVNGLAVVVSGAVGPLEAVARLRWDWGDRNAYDGGFPQSHVYAQPGTYTVKVTVYDRANRVLGTRSVDLVLPTPTPR